MLDDAVPRMMQYLTRLPARLLAGVAINPASQRIGGVLKFDGAIWQVETTQCVLIDIEDGLRISVPADEGEYIADCAVDDRDRLVVLTSTHEWTRDAQPKVLTFEPSLRPGGSTDWREIHLGDGRLPVSVASTEGRHFVGFASCEVSRGVHVGGGIAAVNDNGQIEWLYRAATLRHFVPIAIAFVGRSLFVLDQAQHTLFQLGEDGELTPCFGTPGRPAREDRGLSTPSDVIFDSDGFWIADSRNHRLVRLDATGRFQFEVLAPHIYDPRRIVVDDVALYIADVASSHLIVHERAAIGASSPTRDVDGLDRRLSYPRGVSLRDGVVLVTDTCNDRVLSLPIDGSRDLDPLVINGPTRDPSWPRAAVMSSNGIMGLCEGLNRRVRFRDAHRDWFVEGVVYQGAIHKLVDPHEVIFVGDDEVILTDASGLIARASLTGEARWIAESEDPHSASIVWANRLFITDPLANSLIELSLDSGRLVGMHRELQGAGGVEWQLNRPRASSPIGEMLAVAEGDGTVTFLSSDLVAQARWSGTYSIDDWVYQLRAPRSLCALGHDLTLTDYRNHLCASVSLEAISELLGLAP